MGQVICKGCGQPIWGQYLQALGGNWHPEHFVCAKCGHPIANDRFTVHEGASYHPQCYIDTFLPRCVYCGKPLVGRYLQNYWGQQYCQEHEQQWPHCAFCGRLVPPQEQEPQAENVRCAVCQASGIETAEAAKPIFRQLIQWVGSRGLRYNNLRLSLELCGRAKLAQYAHDQQGIHAWGTTMGIVYSQDGRVTHTEVKGVAVLQGLPITLFEEVTIHELGHVWLMVHGVQNLPQWAEEGFCELLAHMYLSGAGTPESRFHAQNIERNTDPVYGDGFRRMKAIADRTGFARLIESLQTTKRLPPA